MSKIRLLILLFTFFVVGTVVTLISLYARGYRFNTQKANIEPNGLLVLKSHPDSAQIYINGTLKTATNATIPLNPGTYDVSVKKEGFKDWQKRLSIEKEIVTEATAHLFKSAPSLSAFTFAGVTSITPSYDFTKLAYVVPFETANTNSGLWVMATVNLPLGFARDPLRIVDGNLLDAEIIWSPNGREILLTTTQSSYLLDATKFTPQARRVNATNLKEQILTEWELEKQAIREAQTRPLPPEVADVLHRRSAAFQFSPDEEMVVYTASLEGKLANSLIPELPGASTQKQVRDIKPGKTYVYDIKEDRNFIIDESKDIPQLEGGYSNGEERRLSWYSSSRHLILAEKEQIVVMDYDGTNKQVVYSGSYVAPHAYPTLSLDRLLILTNLGATSLLPNLYSLSVK